jgi:hypothetical protein
MVLSRFIRVPPNVSRTIRRSSLPSPRTPSNACGGSPEYVFTTEVTEEQRGLTAVSKVWNCRAGAASPPNMLLPPCRAVVVYS